MTTTTIGWILIITNILPVCSQKCTTPGKDGHMCHRRNVALNRKTSQSSDYTENNRIFASSYAVDGKTGHDLFNTPCTHTSEGRGQYWTVTLDKSHWIYRFTIYNREDDCKDNIKCGARLNGFTVSVGNSSGAYSECYQDNTKNAAGPGDVINEHCTNPFLGNTVKISLSSDQPLTLCEVLLYACDEGTYGPDCGMTCGFCAQGRNVCDTTLGYCPERSPRCMPGYSGVSCDIACDEGTYGPDCGMTCGFCARGRNVCDRAFGYCPDTSPRCMSGYSGVKCNVSCDSGAYGSDCRKECGFCAHGRNVCDKTSGHCPDIISPCMPGYSGVRCDTACKPGTYGLDCNGTCGLCADGQTACNITSGNCPDRPNQPRCMPGYFTQTCDEACADGLWGADCPESCGNCYNGTLCNKRSGECPVIEGNPRCSVGYEGTDKTCRTPCEIGAWGDNCSRNCSQNCEAGGCDVIRGPCQGGCQPGFTGERCVTACSTYRWGRNCEETCGQCHDEAVCDKITGECPPGNPRCATGYTEPQCTPCDAGKWGSNCLFTCSENCVVPTCNVTTGVCEGGCNAGYTGGRCNAVVSGQEINYTAVIISVTVAVTIIIIVFLVLRRRQSGSPQGAATSVTNTCAIQEASNPKVPDQERDSGPGLSDSRPNTYNMAARAENTYEAVTQEYDKFRLSRLDTDTTYTNLS